MKILINISNPDDYRFFLRMRNAFLELGWNIEYLANNILIYLILILKREKAYFVRKTCKKDIESNIFSVVTGRLTHEEAKECSGSFYQFMLDNQPVAKWEMIVIPSGRLACQSGLSDYCNLFGVKTIYTGYANIDGRTFVDPDGTDKQSRLFREPEILDTQADCEHDFNLWKSKYLKNKVKAHNIGQARSVNLKTKIKKTIQVLSCYFERLFGMATENSYHLNDLKNIKPLVYKFDRLDKSVPYILFPLQVSTDIQTLVNYHKGSVIEGLKDAIEISRKEGIRLVVKPHPAEINYRAFQSIMALHDKEGFLLTNENTFTLIMNARKVITINSTVGLEAMICGVQVIFLGESLYKNLTGNRLEKYVMSHLKKVDYFSIENISSETVEDFFKT